MKLTGLILETEYFEDYLSFLTEVLELEVQEVTDLTMRLDLQGTWLEIKRVLSAPHQVATLIEFSLDDEDYQDLVQKVSFFYYRHGPGRFLYLGNDEVKCHIVDPDGRTWTFKKLISPLKNIHLSTRHPQLDS
jgi:hypothetical protein